MGTLSRRTVLALAFALPALGSAHGTEEDVAAPSLVAEPWFLQAPSDLAADAARAGAQGRHLMVLWERAGNPECAEIHQKILRDATIADFVRSRFLVAQLDLSGSRQIADLDGERLPEAKLGEKYGVRFTPTIQVFAADSATKAPRQRELVRLQGFVEPAHALAVFHFVADRAYETETLRQYLRGRIG